MPLVSLRRLPGASGRTGRFLTSVVRLSLLTAAAVAAARPAAELPNAAAETLDARLLAEDPVSLAAQARREGDAERGAIVFYRPELACRKCHLSENAQQRLGPDLSQPGANVSDEYLVDAVLRPSKEIKKGFETISLITVDGKSLTGLLVEDNDRHLVLRDAARGFQRITVPRDAIDQQRKGDISLMPAGQMNALSGRQQFLDLVKYLIEIRDGGPERALALEPPPSLYAARPLPPYESDLDHAGLIADLDDAAFRRGEAIYNRLCVNCHGTHDQPGSLPTSLRFASGKFKNGSDPYSMYQTLTRGFGMMVPQTWMVPRQKYDAIHYIREAYLRSHNPDQLTLVDDDYLARLPKGSSRGPAPSNIVPWEQMDYGPNLVATYEIGDDATNFAYKGNAVRLDAGSGGVSRGRHWMVFDYDTLRGAAAWSGRGFIDWNGINFNGRHAIHPRIAGSVQWANPTGPGWANPETGSFEDPRLRGRDGRPYGPLPNTWAHLRGMYSHGADTLIAYTVGRTEVLELPGLELIELPGEASATRATVADSDKPTTSARAIPVFQRTLQLGPRDRELTMQVAHIEDAGLERPADTASASDSLPQRIALFARPKSPNAAARRSSPRFDGATRLEIDKPAAFEMRDKDYTLLARIRTKSGGTIFAQTGRQADWVHDGKTFFVRGGKLVFDIGWVGAVTSRRSVHDGRPHEVAAVYTADDGQLRLYIDGKLDAQGTLRPKQPAPNQIVRIGYTAANFPRERSFFEGAIDRVRFFQQALSAEQLQAAAKQDAPPAADQPASIQPVGDWKPGEASADRVADLSGNGHDGRFVAQDTASNPSAVGSLVCGLAGDTRGLRWKDDGSGNLQLVIPTGDQPRQFTLWTTRVTDRKQATEVASRLSLDDTARPLDQLTHGGPARWPEVLKTEAVVGESEGPYAVDVLTRPTTNPWFCRLRLTGFDFFEDGDRAAVSSWDGNIWLVSGLSGLPRAGENSLGKNSLGKNSPSKNSPGVELRWRRIASGLFQPLGVKIVGGKIHVTCRDQLCILHDLNGDGETDFYENFNNDHQVTEHFHEFAMGLQVDAEGNFYYAKSARHALPALVPHHGTLLRVSPDGSQTEILATGFRAANGVCLNPDGTFIVTDQEGHWNPKNRINWVRPGGFYGNMYGYHDVTDSSDEAMEQPLCWITNAFDRSPAELLWAKSSRWGPLGGSLLNLSYGYGKIYVVPFEDVAGQKQGGMCELPLPQFPTGVMRGRFHPGDGQLYVCGMFAWAGSQQQPGGFYRIRYTGRDAYLPVTLQARRGSLEIGFSGQLDPASAARTENYQVKVWALKRTANYGSPHIDEHALQVASAKLADDGRTLTLAIPEIGPTWCMEVRYSIQSHDGTPIEGTLHNTIHRLPDPERE